MVSSNTGTCLVRFLRLYFGRVLFRDVLTSKFPKSPTSRRSGNTAAGMLIEKCFACCCRGFYRKELIRFPLFVPFKMMVVAYWWEEKLILH